MKRPPAPRARGVRWAAIVAASLTGGELTAQANPVDDVQPPLPTVTDRTERGSEEGTITRVIEHNASLDACRTAYRTQLGRQDGLGNGWSVAGIATTEQGEATEIALTHRDGLLYRVTLRGSATTCRVEIHGDGHAVAFDALSWPLPTLAPIDLRP